MVERTCCVWCPAWPLVARLRREPTLVGKPAAVLAHGLVCASSGEAHAAGVTAGLRRREAEARCAGLVVVDADSQLEARMFEAVIAAVETVTPLLMVERPGRLFFATRGPSRYFGGDGGLVRRVRQAVHAIGIERVQVGIADGAFAARQAARSVGPSGTFVVDPGESVAFLASLPVEALNDPDLASVLIRLGLPTLGDFATLSAAAVVARFGSVGQQAHRLARGEDYPTSPVPPPPELIETIELDPPVANVETVAFVANGLADRLLGRLDAQALSCTRVAVEAETEHGESLSRSWCHDGAFTPIALVMRVRWQLEAWLADGVVTGGLTLLRLVPEVVLAATGRQLGLWGGDAAAEDRANRALTRLQGMLGPEAVVTPVLQGGRTPLERVRWVPWGAPRDPARPLLVTANENVAWPGQVPGPAPAQVFEASLSAELLDEADQPVVVSVRGGCSSVPVTLRCGALWGGQSSRVESWAGPWPHDVRWWDRRTRARQVLWQLVVRPEGAGGVVACLVSVTRGRAGVDAVYD